TSMVSEQNVIDYRVRRSVAISTFDSALGEGRGGAAPYGNDNDKPLPIRRHVILQKFPPHVLAGVHAGDDRIDDSCGAVHDVQRWMKSVLGGLSCGDVGWIFVCHPTRIDCIH